MIYRDYCKARDDTYSFAGILSRFVIGPGLRVNELLGLLNIENGEVASPLSRQIRIFGWVCQRQQLPLFACFHARVSRSPANGARRKSLVGQRCRVSDRGIGRGFAGTSVYSVPGGALREHAIERSRTARTPTWADLTKYFRLRVSGARPT